MKGFAAAGVDFDALFDPDVIGDGPAAAGYSSAGVPLRYAALVYGTKRADVGYRINGVDVSNLWAAKGTASYALAMNGGSYSAVENIPNLSSGSAQLKVTLKAAGTYEVRAITTHGASTAPGTVVASGTWLPSGGSAADYQVRFTPMHTGGTNAATIANDSAAFNALSADRVFTATLGPSGATSGTRNSIESLTIEVRNASTGTVISTTTITLNVETDGSA